MLLGNKNAVIYGQVVASDQASAMTGTVVNLSGGTLVD
jgi:hypothetical protein